VAEITELMAKTSVKAGAAGGKGNSEGLQKFQKDMLVQLPSLPPCRGLTQPA